MLNISTGKVVRVIALVREWGPDSRALYNYIADMNVSFRCIWFHEGVITLNCGL